jgi:hypothetical protein
MKLFLIPILFVPGFCLYAQAIGITEKASSIFRIAFPTCTQVFDFRSCVATASSTAPFYPFRGWNS